MLPFERLVSARVYPPTICPVTVPTIRVPHTLPYGGAPSFPQSSKPPVQSVDCRHPPTFHCWSLQKLRINLYSAMIQNYFHCVNITSHVHVYSLILIYSHPCHIKKSAHPSPCYRAKFVRWIPQVCAYWRMLHCLPCGSRVDRLARRRLLKQKGQAAEIISGLVPRWKNFAEWLRGNLCIPDREHVDSLIWL